MNFLTRIRKIEEKVGEVSQVDPNDKLQIVVADQSKLDKEVKKREQELAQRYGKEALEQITFIGLIDRFGA